MNPYNVVVFACRSAETVAEHDVGRNRWCVSGKSRQKLRIGFGRPLLKIRAASELLRRIGLYSRVCMKNPDHTRLI